MRQRKWAVVGGLLSMIRFTGKVFSSATPVLRVWKMNFELKYNLENKINSKNFEIWVTWRKDLSQWFFNFFTILPILDILKNLITPT